METEKIGNIINGIGCFGQLTSDEMTFLDKHKTAVDYLKGETVFKQGAFATHVLYVNHGLIKVYLNTGPGKQINLFLGGQDDFIAFSSIFGEDTYQYSAIAVKDASICMIDKSALRTLIAQNPGFAMPITARNCRNEGRYLDIIKNLSYKQMRGKLASALLYLSEDRFLKEAVFAHLTRQDIANFASITVESAIKFIKEFEKEGIVKLVEKMVVIEDRAKLTDLCLKG